MPISFSLPNPLARLTGLLEAVEQARGQAAGEASRDGAARATNGTATSQTDPREALDCLSLSRQTEDASRTHDLEAMSLSRLERNRVHPR